MIVVTGAGGFIGSNLVAALNQAGRRDIVAVDNPGVPESTGNLKDLQVKQFLAKDDALNWMYRHAFEIDAVLHMGACSDTTVTDRAFIMKNNFDYSAAMWDFCKRQGKRFVYASSAATYGDGSAGYDDTVDPNLYKPLNLYGESKQMFDLCALSETRAPAGWAGLKFFNVYGPREQHKGRMASVVFHSFNQIRKTGQVKLFKSDNPEYRDGGQMRDFIYVKDVVAAVLHFMNAPLDVFEKLSGPATSLRGGIFNVGTGKARSFDDLAKAVFNAMKKDERIEYIDMPADLKGKYQYFTQASTEKLRGTGFGHQIHSLEDGVTDYVRNYLIPAIA